MESEKLQTNQLSIVHREFGDWLSQHALPTWFEYGIDWNNGGFFEDIYYKTLRSDKNYKRLRVAARQIYVFSYAHRSNLGDFNKAIDVGIDQILKRHRIQDGAFSSKLGLQYEVIDNNLSLYDLAFCIFAFAQAFITRNDPNLEREAVNLLNYIEKNFAHELGGYHDQLPTCSLRSQDPHMHLFEACLAWIGISNNDIFAHVADKIYYSLCRYFYDHGNHCIKEYFKQNLSPLDGDQGLVVKPGHQYEWVWLLSQYEERLKSKLDIKNSIYDFASKYSFSDISGLLNDEVYPTGRMKSQSVRLWPHTEWLKAEAVMDPSGRQVHKAWSALKKFFDCPRDGLWFERWDPIKKHFVDEPSPASSLYHIVLSYEVLNTILNDRLGNNQ